MRSVVVLPQPDGPSIEKNSPRRIPKFAVVDRDEARERLRDVFELDDLFQRRHPPRCAGRNLGTRTPLAHVAARGPGLCKGFRRIFRPGNGIPCGCALGQGNIVVSTP